MVRLMPAAVVSCAAAQPHDGAGGAGGAAAEDLTRLVDPLIGTASYNNDDQADDGFNTGNTFPGATFPFGMVQLSPDNAAVPGGYRYASTKIDAFSFTHFSGRGIGCWEDVGVLPTMGAVTTSPGTNWGAWSSPFRHTTEQASPGRYRVTLDDHGIDAELTVTPRTGMARFTFPAAVAGDAAATLLINAGHSAAGNSAAGTQVTVVPPNRIIGSAQSGNCGGSFSYRIYFAAEVDHPFSSFGTWSGDALTPGQAQASGAASGAWLSFAPGTTQVALRVGLSFVSTDGAAANLAAENGGPWDFDTVADAARAAWDARLHAIEVTGGTGTQRTVFYTALYHTMLHPNLFDDADGRYLGFDGAIDQVAAGHHQYENFAGWDNYRSEMPLLAIIARPEMSDMLASLVDMAARDPGGGLPRWQQAASNSGGMVGDSQPVVLATGHAFGVRSFDTDVALAAMDRGASDPGTTSAGHTVREGLDSYLSKGYVSTDDWGSAAITLEYAIDDFAIAQLAAATGHTDLRDRYLARAGNWRNLWSPANGGFIAPRDATGTFSDVHADTTDGFVESSAEEYVWMIPHDVGGLIDAMGGGATAVARLDTFFTELNARGAHAFMGNEPGESGPWVYDFAQAPHRTQDVVRRILLQLFTAAPNGLPGNDDAGALSSWAVFGSIGLFPGIPGVGGFLVGSPLFPRTVLHLDGDRALQIEAPDASAPRRYVTALRLNSRAHDAPWIDWADLAGGATLQFTLADAPDPTWGASAAVAPPSLSR